MKRPTAILIGGIGKLPYAGVSLYYLHYVRGLQALGYDVHYVERQNRRGEYYDPRLREMTDSLAYAFDYLGSLPKRFGVSVERCSVIDLQGECHGAGWDTLRAALNRAEFVLTVADPTWFGELVRCRRRAYVDGDPVFTQAAMLSGEGARASAPDHYPVLFTYGARMGEADCSVPTAGREWIPTRPVVATDLWEVTPTAGSLPITALLHWAAGSEVSINGNSYGHKDRELERLIDLPRRTKERFVLAVGGKRAPRALLAEHGWEIADPLAATLTFNSYRSFIAASKADLGIAKHAYVASRSGWFSDRSTCFLAAGRPVLHQDTGCGEWLPAGEGILLFSDLDDLIHAVDELQRHYDRHARASRRIAEEHFEARVVIGRMLEAAGFR